MGVIRIKSSDQYKDAITSSGLSAIEFTAPWDEPSKAISPKFAAFASAPKYAALKFYQVDLNESQDVAMDSGVKLAPTFHFYKDGERVGEYVGSSYPALERTLASYSHA